MKAALLESNFRNHTVLQAVEERLRAPDPEDDSDSLARRQDEALTALLARPELKADHFVAALPGELCSTRFVALPFSDARKIAQTIEGELADLLPFDIDEATFDHALLSKGAEGSLSLAVATPNDKLGPFLSRLQEAGADPKYLGVDSLQLFNLFSHYLAEDSSKPVQPNEAEPDPEQTAAMELPAEPSVGAVEPPRAQLPDGRMILDIGHERTLLMVAGPDGVAHNRVIHAGGAAVTQAIAESFQLGWAEAEQAKHQEGTLATRRHPAPTDLAAQLSEVVAHGLTELVRQLRRTLQSIRRERRVQITRIDLVGGGSKIRHLASYLAEALGIPVAPGLAVEQAVERQAAAERRPAFALALALALSTGGAKRVSKINLRRGDFAFAGSMEHLRRRLPFMVGALAALLLLAIVGAIVRFQVVGDRLDAVNEQFCLATEKVVGRRVCEPAVALSLLSQPSGELGSFRLPERSAYLVAAEISAAMPQPLSEATRIVELDVSNERARIEGRTSSFEAVDQLSTALSKNPCFGEVKKNRLNKNTAGTEVEFQLSIRLEGCRP